MTGSDTDRPSILLRGVTAIDPESWTPVAGSPDLLIENGRVAGCSSGAAHADVVIDCRDSIALPGLHDHHLHLLATAATRWSVDCGAPEVIDRQSLAARLRAAEAHDGWIRAINYDDASAGLPDRTDLDRIRHDIPIRMQHRSGAVWLLNSAAVDQLGVEVAGDDLGGAERDAAGRATGRLWRADAWLGRRLGASTEPDLGALSAELAGLGITGVTDATPDLSDAAATLIAAARGAGRLRQATMVLGRDSLDPGIDAVGPRKILVGDHELPSLDDLTSRVLASSMHPDGRRTRPVALHCVTKEALWLALAVFEVAGSIDGDRIEHAAVVPREATAVIAAAGLTVVTQPALVARRGEDYLDRVGPEFRELLWPYRSLLDAGVRVASSSDAPYGPLDPWTAIRAAVDRRTSSGRSLSAARESVPAATALRAYLTSADDPAGRARSIASGHRADLVVMSGSLADVLHEPDSSWVRATIIDGCVTYLRSDVTPIVSAHA